MILGLFAKTFSRPSLAATLDAVADSGLHCVQFNFACCGLPTVPERIEDAVLAEAAQALAARGISVAAISGTFNLIHPDRKQRDEGVRRLPVLDAAAQALGSPMITLCTGSRDPQDMWHAHPANATPDAWRDLRASLDQALAITASSGILLGIEPEQANVVSSARACRRLLDEVGSPRLRVVMDGANLLTPADLGRQGEVFREAFDLLGPDIALAHAKEIAADGGADGRGAGSGSLDWDEFIAGLRRVGYTGALILHGLSEASVGPAVAYLRAKV